jgi:hypothetical protein
MAGAPRGDAADCELPVAGHGSSPAAGCLRHKRCCAQGRGVNRADNCPRVRSIGETVHRTRKSEWYMVPSINTSSYGAEAMEAMRQNRFKKIDQDGDGKISKNELKAGMPSKGNGPSVEDIFSKVDTNQDGMIDQTEDKAAFEQMRKNPPPGGPPDAAKMATRLFKKADADGDGKITIDELSAALPNDTKGLSAQDLFNSVDSDDDGTISQSELEESIKKMMEQRQANFPPPESSRADSYDRTGGSKAKSATSLFSMVA